MKTNIYNIAEEAGVSISTVSRVLNNSKNVSNKTRKKVQDIINKRSYTPSDAARGLVTKKTMSIGILVTDIRNPFHSICSYEIEKSLRKLGYMTILANTTDDPIKQERYIKLLYNRGVDGIFLIGSGYKDKKINKLCNEINKNISVVGINTEVVDSNCVLLDEKDGIKIALNHLKSKGYKKPAYIGVKNKFISRASINKYESFSIFSKKMFNLDENIYILEKNDNVYFDFLSEIKTKKYDSIQFETDDIALRFVRILVNNNIKVPEDIAVIGFDNLDILNYGIKKLTTIDHKSKKLCKVGVEKLVGQINGEKIEAKTVIKPSFINGETT